MNTIEQKYLKECLTHNNETGVFTWNKRPVSHFIDDRVASGWNSRYANSIAGHICANKRVAIEIDAIQFYAHRLVIIYYDGECNSIVDHINGIPTDNRKCNLRLATPAENSQNRKIPIVNTSGVKGVSVHKGTGKYIASVTCNWNRVHLGLFDDIEEAAEAVRLKRIELHGEFACDGR